MGVYSGLRFRRRRPANRACGRLHEGDTQPCRRVARRPPAQESMRSSSPSGLRIRLRGRQTRRKRSGGCSWRRDTVSTTSLRRPGNLPAGDSRLSRPGKRMGCRAPILSHAELLGGRVSRGGALRSTPARKAGFVTACAWCRPSKSGRIGPPRFVRRMKTRSLRAHPTRGPAPGRRGDEAPSRRLIRERHHVLREGPPRPGFRGTLYPLPCR